MRITNRGVEPLELTLRVAGLDATGAPPAVSLGRLDPGAALRTALHFALPADTASR